MTTGTLDREILASLRNSDMRDVHRLYDAALSFAALAGLFAPATLRAVADRLSDEATRTHEEHERTMLLAMALFLASESEVL